MNVIRALMVATADAGHARGRTLRGMGVRPAAIAAAVRDGLVVRPFRGIYALAPPQGLWAIQAAVAATGGIASHQTAALLWGLPLLGSTLTTHVSIKAKQQRRHRAGITLHWSDQADGDVVAGIPVTTLLRTVLDCARVLPLREAVAVADAALRTGAITAEELSTAATRARGPGSARIRRVAELADGRAESLLESWLRVLLIEHGLIPSALQLVVCNGRHRADLAFVEQRLLVEAEGFEHHGQRSGLQRDCRRGNAYALDRYWVLRFSWEDVMEDEDYVVATVRAAL